MPGAPIGDLCFSQTEPPFPVLQSVVFSYPRLAAETLTLSLLPLYRATGMDARAGVVEHSWSTEYKQMESTLICEFERWSAISNPYGPLFSHRLRAGEKGSRVLRIFKLRNKDSSRA